MSPFVLALVFYVCFESTFGEQEIIVNLPKPVGEYPWDAFIYLKQDHTYQCGGTIVSTNKIMTVAYCVLDDEKLYPPSAIVVAVGKYNVSLDVQEPHQQLFEVSKMTTYFEDHFIPNLFHRFDIAIIEVNRDILFNEWVKPVSINKVNYKELFQHPPPGTVVSWSDGTETHDMSKDHEFEVYDWTLCRKNVRIYHQSSITIDRFCVKLPDGVKSYKPGLIGKGIVYTKKENNKDTFHICGILSGSGKDAVTVANVEDYLTLLTNVTYHMAWIEGILRGEQAVCLVRGH